MKPYKYTAEESMNVVLDELNKDSFFDFYHLQGLVNNEHFRFSMLKPMLLTMEEDGYVRKNDNGVSGREEYSITTKGKIFLRDGGYVKQKELNAEIYRDSKEILKVTKQGLTWAKIAAISGIVSIILTIIFFIYSSSH